MWKKRISLAFFLIVLATLLGSDSISNKGKTLSLTARSDNAIISDKSSAIQDESGKYLTDGEIESAIRKFKSRNESESKEAAAACKMLLDNSKRSPACRDKIIKALMKAMDKPNLDFNRDIDSYFLWLYGAELLGKLKAVEAMDLLIKHLTLQHIVFSMSMSHQPALIGVVEMGSVAIPKLTEVLQHNSDKEMRYFAAWSIATIGGKEAVNALKESLESETDKCVKSVISISLDNFNNDGRIKNRLDWFGEIYAKCNE